MIFGVSKPRCAVSTLNFRVSTLMIRAPKKRFEGFNASLFRVLNNAFRV